MDAKGGVGHPSCRQEHHRHADADQSRRSVRQGIPDHDVYPVSGSLPDGDDVAPGRSSTSRSSTASELWARDPQGVRDLPATVTREARNTLATRSDRAVARRDRRPHDAACAARRQGSGRTCAARPRVVRARLHSGRAVHRRRVFTAQEDDVRRRHAGPPERRGRVFGLSRRRGRADRVQASRRSGAQAIARTITDIRINTPDRSRALQASFLSLRLLLSCAEASGDLYAGALDARAAGARARSVQVAGLGGPHFQAAGGELIADYRGIAVTGLTEALSKVPEVLAVRRRLLEAARARARLTRSSSSIRPTSISVSRPASSDWAFRSSTTSARKSGHGGRAGSTPFGDSRTASW